VTVRNVIVDPGGSYALNVDTGADFAVVEYSRFNASSGEKVFRVNGNNATFRRNEATGGQDCFWMGAPENLLVENNYYHDATGGPSAHADGFQWAPGLGQQVTTTTIIRGNYFDLNNPTIGVTEILWAADNGALIIFESNYLKPWGGLTIRAWGDPGSPVIARYNVYDDIFQTLLGSGEMDSRYDAAWSVVPEVLDDSAFICNRYADGSFIEQTWVKGGTTHVTTGCPSYP